MVFFFPKDLNFTCFITRFFCNFSRQLGTGKSGHLIQPQPLKDTLQLARKSKRGNVCTINTRILRVIARVNAAVPVACTVILTFNRNCQDYNDQKDIYPREHQSLQGLLCADFLHILVTSGSEVQGILKALAHWKTTTYNNSYLVWLTTKTITTRNEPFQYSLIRLPDQPTCFLVSGLRQFGARRKRLEFQLVLWVSSSLHILLARDHFLLNDFIKGWLFGSLPIGQVSLNSLTCSARKSTCPWLPDGTLFKPWITRNIVRLERFSYDLEKKTSEQNRNNKRTEIERFDWFIERIQTRVAFGFPRTF